MNRTELLTKLNIVMPAVSTKDFQPVLKCIKSDALTLNAYNGELYISTLFSSDLNCTIPAEGFSKLLSTLKQDTIEIEQQNNTLLLKAGRMKSTVALCEDTFPDPPLGEVTSDSEITTDEAFLRKLKIAKLFIGKDETQPVYRGIFLKGRNMYATDGYRIMRTSNFDVPPPVFLPELFCDMLIKHTPATFQIFENVLSFSKEGTRIICNKIHVEPPDYDSLFNRVEPTSTLIPVPELLQESFPRLEIFTDGLADKHCSLKCEGELMTIKMRNALGEIEEVIEIENIHVNQEVTTDLTLLKTLFENMNKFQFGKIGDTPIVIGEMNDVKVLLTTT